MTRIIAIAILAVFASHMTAHASGKSSYYSDADDRSASYNALSTVNPAA